jgi:hypothetical protein
MTCPICSLYFQDIEQEAFRHHAFSRHSSTAMYEALHANGIVWNADAVPGVHDKGHKEPPGGE